MAKYLLLSVLLLASVLSSLLLTSESECCDSAAARKKVVRHIGCEVCQKLASNFYYHLRRKESEISPKPMSVDHIRDVKDSICDSKKQEADWIRKTYIVKRGDTYGLVDQEDEDEGWCNSDCETIEYACYQVIAPFDDDDADYLDKSESQLVDYLCRLAKACIIKPPSVPMGMSKTPNVQNGSGEEDAKSGSNLGEPGTPDVQTVGGEEDAKSRSDLVMPGTPNVQNGGGEEDAKSRSDLGMPGTPNVQNAGSEEDAKSGLNLGRAPGAAFVPEPAKEPEMEKTGESIEGMLEAPNMHGDELMNVQNGSGEEMNKKRGWHNVEQLWRSRDSGSPKKSKSSKSEL